MANHPKRLSDVERGIKNMLDAGFGWGAETMRDLHQKLLAGNYAKMNAAECIKIALKIRYKIEPTMYPAVSMTSRIENLYVLQSFLNAPLPGMTTLQDIPMKAESLLFISTST